MKKYLISIFLITFLTSCAQIQGMTDKKEEYGTDNERERVMSKKIEDRDMKLPDGSTILDDETGFSIGGTIGGLFSNGNSSSDLGADSLTFSVALDKVSFMPLLSVDTLSGVIITDWYSIDGGKSRIKINVRVVDQEMTNESLTVSLFTQTLDGGQWVDNGVNKEQSLRIKESILSSARSLKIALEL